MIRKAPPASAKLGGKYLIYRGLSSLFVSGGFHLVGSLFLPSPLFLHPFFVLKASLLLCPSPFLPLSVSGFLFVSGPVL